MKKILLSVLAAIMVVCAAVAFAACGNGNEDGGKEVTITLSEVKLELTVGDTKSLVATTSDGSVVSWSTSNKDVADVSSRGLVTAQGAGTATITAKSGEVTATCEVTVKAKEVVTISGLDATATVERGETITLSATASDGSTVLWTSGDSQIASVSDSGVVTGVYPGEVVVYASTESGARANCTVTVTYENAPEGWYEISFYEQNKVPAGTWGYWNDQNWNGSQVTMTAKPEYLGDSENSQAGSATFSFTASGHCTFGMQIVYRNAELVKNGKYYTLDCKINVDVDCVITVNGNRVELKAGDNDVSVNFLCDDDGHIYDQGDYTNLSSAVFIQMGSAVDDTMVEAATITISELHWTEYTPSALIAPTLAIADDKTVTITDTANDEEAVGSYQVGLFDAEGNLVWSATMASGDKIDDSKCPDGEYTAKVRVIAADVGSSNSDWSAEGVTYTVANGGISYDVEYGVEDVVVSDPYTWYYWWEYYAADNAENPTASYDDGVLEMTFTGNTGNFWCTQLFYKNSALAEGERYSVTMTINSTVAGHITVNGKAVELKVGDNQISIDNATQGAKATISIQMGVNGSAIDIEAATIKVSNVVFGAPVADAE